MSKNLTVRWLIFCFGLFFCSYTGNIAAAGGTGPADSLSNLVVWYNFDESGEVITDLSGHGNDAKIIGRVTRVKGVNGNAAHFDGQDSYLNCGNNESLRLTSNFTVSFWVQTLPSPRPYPIIVSWGKPGDNTYPGWDVHSGHPYPGRYPVFFANGGGIPGWGPCIDDGQWRHYAVTFDNDKKVTWYINGEKHQSQTMPASAPIRSHDGDLTLGKLYAGAGAENYAFKGMLDEFRMYNRVLSENEIQGLYEAARSGICTPQDIALRDATRLSSVLLDYATLQWGSNKANLKCSVPPESYPNLSKITLRLSGSERVIIEKQISFQNDKLTPAFLTIPEIEPGIYTLSVFLKTPDGRTLKERKQSVTVCRRLFKKATDTTRVQKGDIYLISNFRDFAPAVSSESKKNTWYFEKYKFTGSETAQEYLSADGLVSILKNPVPLKGWYAVYLGLVNPGKGIQAYLAKQKEKFIQYEPSLPVSGNQKTIEEKLLRCVQLEGDETLALNASSRFSPAGLAYVKFVCLTNNQIAVANGTEDIYKDKKFIPYNDGEIFIFQCDDLSKIIPEYITDFKKESDIFDIYAVTAGIGVMYYDTKIGTIIPVPADNPGWRNYAGAERVPYNIQTVSNLRQWISQGNSPIGTAVEAAHKNGIKLEVNLRMNWGYPLGKGDQGVNWNSKWQEEHPQYQIKMLPDASVSDGFFDYFHPEWREERFGILQEIARRFDVDIITLDYSRWPAVLGMAAAESFQTKFGRPPDLFADGGDQEWYRYRAGFMTDFVRRVRRMLDEEGREKGKRIELWTQANYANFLATGLDLEDWVREGLVDAIIAGNDGVTYSAQDYSLKELRLLVKGTRCKIYVRSDMYMKPEMPSLDEVKRTNVGFFQQGADGIYMYNMWPFRDLSLYQNLQRWADFEDSAKMPVSEID